MIFLGHTRRSRPTDVFARGVQRIKQRFEWGKGNDPSRGLLKQRDFQSKDFEVTSGPDCRLHIVGDPALAVATLAPRRRGNVANKDGKDEVAIALIKANPKLSVRKSVELLKESGIKRGKDWIQTKRYELAQKNGGQMP
jgi:hypothetical protein